MSEKFLIVSKMKNEGPFILEWIAHNLAIGFSDFLIYSNDCTDGTDVLLDVLHKHKIIVHRQNPFRKTNQTIHKAVYSAARKEQVYKNADWIVTIDVDEYINIHAGDGTLQDLLAKVPEANLISMTWRLFGNSGHLNYESGPITRQFTHCAKQDTARPLKAWCVKTLFRNDNLFKILDTHRPKQLREGAKARLNWVNGSGERFKLTDKWLRQGIRSTNQNVGHDLVSVNHYAVRSCESFLTKINRGDAIDDRAVDVSYWFNHNNNETQDASIERTQSIRQEHLDRLLSNDEIRIAHENCVKSHKAEIRDLLGRPSFQKVYNDISSNRMHYLSENVGRFAQSVFADPQGYQKIPNAFFDAQLPSSAVFTLKQSEQHPGKDTQLFKLDPFMEPAGRNWFIPTKFYNYLAVPRLNLSNWLDETEGYKKKCLYVTKHRGCPWEFERLTTLQHPGYKLDTVKFSDFQESDTPYQIVIAEMLLNHLDDPVQGLTNAKSKLTSDGYLFVSVPHVMQHTPNPIDTGRWSTAGLQNLLTQAGFKEENIQLGQWGEREALISILESRKYLVDPEEMIVQNDPNYPIVSWAFAQNSV